MEDDLLLDTLDKLECEDDTKLMETVAGREVGDDFDADKLLEVDGREMRMPLKKPYFVLICRGDRVRSKDPKELTLFINTLSLLFW